MLCSSVALCDRRSVISGGGKEKRMYQAPMRERETERERQRQRERQTERETDRQSNKRMRLETER